MVELFQPKFLKPGTTKAAHLVKAKALLVILQNLSRIRRVEKNRKATESERYDQLVYKVLDSFLEHICDENGENEKDFREAILSSQTKDSKSVKAKNLRRTVMNRLRLRYNKFIESHYVQLYFSHKAQESLVADMIKNLSTVPDEKIDFEKIKMEGLAFTRDPKTHFCSFSAVQGFSIVIPPDTPEVIFTGLVRQMERYFTLRKEKGVLKVKKIEGPLSVDINRMNELLSALDAIPEKAIKFQQIVIEGLRWENVEVSHGEKSRKSYSFPDIGAFSLSATEEEDLGAVVLRCFKCQAEVWLRKEQQEKAEEEARQMKVMREHLEEFLNEAYNFIPTEGEETAVYLEAFVTLKGYLEWFLNEYKSDHYEVTFDSVLRFSTGVKKTSIKGPHADAVVKLYAATSMYVVKTLENLIAALQNKIMSRYAVDGRVKSTSAKNILNYLRKTLEQKRGKSCRLDIMSSELDHSEQKILKKALKRVVQEAYAAEKRKAWAEKKVLEPFGVETDEVEEDEGDSVGLWEQGKSRDSGRQVSVFLDHSVEKQTDPVKLAEDLRNSGIFDPKAQPLRSILKKTSSSKQEEQQGSRERFYSASSASSGSSGDESNSTSWGELAARFNAFNRQQTLYCAKEGQTFGELEQQKIATRQLSQDPEGEERDIGFGPQ